MNSTPCDQLDDFLADGLADGDRAVFEAHLADCRLCRQEVEHQHRIDRLLVEGTEQLDSFPPSLIGSIEARIKLSERRRRDQLAWGLSAAAAVLLLLGVWSVSQRARPRFDLSPIADKQDMPALLDEGVEPSIAVPYGDEHFVRVTPSDPSSAILVPTRTTAQNVSIVWVYPTVMPTTPGDSETN